MEIKIEPWHLAIAYKLTTLELNAKANNISIETRTFGHKVQNVEPIKQIQTQLVASPWKQNQIFW